MAGRLLVVDDDAKIRALIAKYISKEGYEVEEAPSAAEAAERISSSRFDLLIVDKMMPRQDGFNFIRSLRQKGIHTPAIILSAADGRGSKLEGLATGADDFLPKPFIPKELLLRIAIILRRTGVTSARGLVSFGLNSYDRESGILNRRGKLVRLTDTEKSAINMLLDRDGEPLSRYDMAQKLGLSARSVDVWIARLRQKVEDFPKMPEYIQTVRNIGYRFVK
ncbi:MAG: response regulator transcription factor [Rickettsiales bacterium]|nr:response regulator transcription factor [Rickettsiales bacterium]